MFQPNRSSSPEVKQEENTPKKPSKEQTQKKADQQKVQIEPREPTMLHQALSTSQTKILKKDSSSALKPCAASKFYTILHNDSLFLLGQFKCAIES